MQLRRTSPWKHSGADRPLIVTHAKPQTNKAEEEGARSLAADVMFFVDHAISLAVGAVARKQAQSARLMVTGKSGANLHVSVAAAGEDDGEDSKFVAYNNDMCLFVGSSPSLYVVNQTARELEHSIYLYISERLSGECAVSAQIFRETGTMFELPILEGSSELGPRSLKPRQAGIFDD